MTQPDKTAIDEDDDFGRSPDSLPMSRRATYRWGLFTLSLIITGFCVFAEVSMLYSQRIGNHWLVLGMYIPGQMFVPKALQLVGVSQLSCAVSGVMAIVNANMWGWPKFYPGTKQRAIFDLTKWSITTVLIMADAYILEHLYEFVFITQRGTDFMRVP